MHKKFGPTSLGMLVAAALLSAQSASADDQMLKVSGYGTFGMTSMSSDQGDFRGSFPDVPTGVGRSASVSAAPDSRLAVQVDLSVSDSIEAVAQLMARQNRFNNYLPSFELLNVKYKFNTRTSVRVGRIAHPFFMSSDTRQIGYAQTYIRGPYEVYGQSSITNSDVVQLSHRQPVVLGNLLVTAGFGQAKYGNPPSDPAVSNEDAGTLKQMTFADALWEVGALQLRLGFTTGSNDFTVNRLSGLYKAASALNPASAEELGFVDKKVSFTGLGFSYDPGDYVLQGEYTMTRWGLGGKSIAPNADAHYILGGLRHGAWTPYAIYSKRVTDSPRTVSEFPSAQLNAAFTAIAAGTAIEQHTVSAGVRYDLQPGIALKLQFDNVTQDGAAGYLTNLNAANPPKKGSQYNVVGLNLDFTF